MPRQSRLRVQGESWQHIYSKIACEKGKYPLTKKPGAAEYLIETFRFYTQAYFCDVAGFCIMGNHYHIVIKFDEYRDISDDDARERAYLLYPNRKEWVDSLGGENLDKIKKRLFNVSELMRNVHGHYGRWFNKTYKREGRFWSDRFKSVILADEEAILNCLQYIDLNPVRAKLKSRPESWVHGSYHLRDMKKDKWLMDIRSIMGLSSKKESYIAYRERLYYMGGVQTKENKGIIPSRLLKKEEQSGFKSRNLLLKQSKHFTRGLVLGSEFRVKEWLERLRDEGVYKRKNKTIKLDRFGLSSLR